MVVSILRKRKGRYNLQWHIFGVSRSIASFRYLGAIVCESGECSTEEEEEEEESHFCNLKLVRCILELYEQIFELR